MKAANAHAGTKIIMCEKTFRKKSALEYEGTLKYVLIETNGGFIQSELIGKTVTRR